MTEIEKMFENANAYKILCNCEFKNLYDYRIEYGSDVCDYTESKIKEPCKVCKKAKQKIKYYPDFTAEKQLKLIEWFISNSWWLNLKSLDKKLDFSLDFDEKLAKLVNRLWESFDDQEKEEIRGILNE